MKDTFAYFDSIQRSLQLNSQIIIRYHYLKYKKNKKPGVRKKSSRMIKIQQKLKEIPKISKEKKQSSYSSSLKKIKVLRTYKKGETALIVPSSPLKR